MDATKVKTGVYIVTGIQTYPQRCDIYHGVLSGETWAMEGQIADPDDLPLSSDERTELLEHGLPVWTNGDAIEPVNIDHDCMCFPSAAAYEEHTAMLAERELAELEIDNDVEREYQRELAERSGYTRGELVSLLDCQDDARVIEWVMRADISIDHARLITQRAIARHAETQYDALCRRYGRAAARRLIEIETK